MTKEADQYQILGQMQIIGERDVALSGARRARQEEEDRARRQRNSANRELDEMKSKVKELEASLLGWRHSSTAFKAMQRQYGKELGKTDEQRQADFDALLISVAEESPEFKNTEPYRNAIAKQVKAD